MSHPNISIHHNLVAGLCNLLTKTNILTTNITNYFSVICLNRYNFGIEIGIFDIVKYLFANSHKPHTAINDREVFKVGFFLPHLNIFGLNKFKGAVSLKIRGIPFFNKGIINEVRHPIHSGDYWVFFSSLY